jgi:hypothetical protein
VTVAGAVVVRSRVIRPSQFAEPLSPAILPCAGTRPRKTGARHPRRVSPDAARAHGCGWWSSLKRASSPDVTEGARRLFAQTFVPSNLQRLGSEFSQLSQCLLHVRRRQMPRVVRFGLPLFYNREVCWVLKVLQQLVASAPVLGTRRRDQAHEQLAHLFNAVRLGDDRYDDTQRLCRHVVVSFPAIRIDTTVSLGVEIVAQSSNVTISSKLRIDIRMSSSTR